MSVWAAIAALGLYHFAPLANWPFAMSFLYVMQGNLAGLAFRSLNDDRQITLTVDDNWNISMNTKFDNAKVAGVLHRTLAHLTQKQAEKAN